MPFGIANAGTYRIEVRDPTNPLFVAFLTVLQPGDNTSAPPTDTAIASLDGKMTGVDIAQGAAHRIVLFNSQPGQVPPPITTTSFNVTGAGALSYTLLGMVPGAHYAAAVSAGVMHVDQNVSGAWTASSAGALHYCVDTIYANGFE